jgi:predicted metal-dependent hydrolase
MTLLRPSPSAPEAQLELPLADPAAGERTSSGPSGVATSPNASDAPGWPQPQPNARKLQIGERTLHYTLKRSARRTIGFTIDDRGLSLAAPRWVTLADIESAILEKQRWIFAKLGEWQNRTSRRVLPAVQWCEGATLPFLGKPVTLRLDSPSGTLVFDADTAVLHLALPDHAAAQQIKDRVQGWLQQQARRLLRERLDVYAGKLGVRYQAFALTSATTRWGSCTADGKIRLNWRLLHFPLAVIDYVAAHELAHLKEMNHSPRFWDTVASIFPEFKDARTHLKSHPPEYLPTY